MSLVHVLLCHSDPAYVGDLFRFLYRSQDRFLIHADAKAPPALHRFLADLAARFRTVHVLPARECAWGGFSLVAAVLDGIHAALPCPGWEHLTVLTEQHLPLMPPDAIARHLQPGVSYVEAVPVSSFGPEVRQGVRNRFAWRYRELPGVGAFATVPRPLDADWAERHWQGSQCVVLARNACHRVDGAAAHITERFGGAVMADENALQTALHGSGIGAGLAIRSENPTWVATPYRGGTEDAVLTPRALDMADAHGSLFIRKRPAVLPDALAERLDSWAALSPAALPAATAASRADRQAEVEALARGIAGHLAAEWPRGAFEIVLPSQVANCPSCYLRVRTPELPSGTAVSIVSQNLRHFKVVLSAAPSVQVPAQVPFYPMSVRVAGLFGDHEWQVAGADQHGFVTLLPGQGPDRLAAEIGVALRFAAACART